MAADPPDAASLSIAEPWQAVASAKIAFARYIGSLGGTTCSRAWQTVTIEIDASLPALAKQGRLEAIRRSGVSANPEYQVLHIEGDSIVKQQVIARYLAAEREAQAIPKASVAVSQRITSSGT